MVKKCILRPYNRNTFKYGYYSCKTSKTELTNLDKYGCTNVMGFQNIKDIVKNKRIVNHTYNDPQYESDFLLYRKSVNNVTLKNKKILYKLWDGFGYYDNEDVRP